MEETPPAEISITKELAYKNILEWVYSRDFGNQLSREDFLTVLEYNISHIV